MCCKFQRTNYSFTPNSLLKAILGIENVIKTWTSAVPIFIFINFTTSPLKICKSLLISETFFCGNKVTLMKLWTDTFYDFRRSRFPEFSFWCTNVEKNSCQGEINKWKNSVAGTSNSLQFIIWHNKICYTSQFIIFIIIRIHPKILHGFFIGRKMKIHWVEFLHFIILDEILTIILIELNLRAQSSCYWNMKELSHIMVKKEKQFLGETKIKWASNFHLSYHEPWRHLN